MSALEKKLARDVAKLRKLVMQLRYCYTIDGLCEDCDFGGYHRQCDEIRLSRICEVLAATAKKPRKP